MNDVREQLKYVAENSDYVKINYTQLDNFINSLGEPNYQHWYNFTSLNLNDILFNFYYIKNSYLR